MNKTKIIVAAIAACTLALLVGLSNAKEPVRPTVGNTFDAKKEAKIRELKDLPLEEAFEKLKDVDFMLNPDFLNKAIFTSFKHRIDQAIDYCIADLSMPRTEMVNGEMQSRQNFHIATRTLRVFPRESLPRLLEIYNVAEPITRGNIIVVLSKLEGGEAIRNLLINALDDKTVCNDQSPDTNEEPFRICDEAYNQLLFRYKIYKGKKGLPFITDANSIDARDHYIDLLKSRL
jgi:hypothetical protein